MTEPKRTSLALAVAEIIREKIPCGQVDTADANDCNKIWRGYGRQCPECPCPPEYEHEIAARIMAKVFDND